MKYRFEIKAKDAFENECFISKETYGNELSAINAAVKYCLNNSINLLDVYIGVNTLT